MKITKQRLKEIIKEEVAKTIAEKDTSQADMHQARKDIRTGTTNVEKKEISDLVQMLITYSKQKNLTMGLPFKLIQRLKQAMSDQMKQPLSSTEDPIEEDGFSGNGPVAEPADVGEEEGEEDVSSNQYVDMMLRNIDKINRSEPYAALLNKVIAHAGNIPGSAIILRKLHRSLPSIIGQEDLDEISTAAGAVEGAPAKEQ